MIVADATPFIAFARGGHFDLLPKVTGKVAIPPAVYQEVVVEGKGRPGSKEVKSADWIEVMEVANRDKLNSLSPTLGKGEKESIVLAKEQKAALITDDSRAREEARKRGVKLISSLDLLQEAKRRTIISEVKKYLDELIAGGFYISSEVYEEVLIRAGEEENSSS